MVIGFVAGLGLRASLPKMPSFRRKKIPSPIPVEDEESKDMSDQEEIIRDDEAEDLEGARKPEQVPERTRKVSSSSSSSSSGFSSDDESSSSDESSSDESDREVKQINRSDSPLKKDDAALSGDLPAFEPLDDGIMERNKTPVPMQVKISLYNSFLITSRKIENMFV